MSTPKPVDVYPVGLLADLLFLARTRQRAPEHTPDAWRKLRYGWRTGWRKRSYWNGYLAEPNPDNGRTGAGHGWTKARALRSLDRRFVAVVEQALREDGHV
jgi:hypothetical protein